MFVYALVTLHMLVSLSLSKLESTYGYTNIDHVVAEVECEYATSRMSCCERRVYVCKFICCMHDCLCVMWCCSGLACAYVCRLLACMCCLCVCVCVCFCVLQCVVFCYACFCVFYVCVYVL